MQYQLDPEMKENKQRKSEQETASLKTKLNRKSAYLLIRHFHTLDFIRETTKLLSLTFKIGAYQLLHFRWS